MTSYCLHRHVISRDQRASIELVVKQLFKLQRVIASNVLRMVKIEEMWR